MGFFKKGLHTYIFSIVNILLALGTSILVARLLGPENKGILTSIVLIPTFLTMIGNVGISISNVFYIAKNNKKTIIAFSNSLIASLILSIILFPIGILIVHIFKEKWFTGIPFKYIILSFSLLPLGLLKNYVISILRGFNKIELSNYVNFSMNLSYFILILLLYKIYLVHIISVLIIFVLSNIIAVIVSLYNLNKCIKLKIQLTKVNIIEFKKNFLYGFRGYLSNIFSFLNYRIDMFLIMKFLNPAMLGIYSVAVTIAEKIWLLPNVISYVLFPHIAIYKDKKMTPLLSRWIFIVMVIISALLVIVLKPLIILVYSKAYQYSYTPFIYLLPGIIFLSIGKLMASDVIGRGYTKYTLNAAVISALVNILLNIVLIPKYQLKGAAIASSFSYSINTFYLIWAHIKLTGNSLKELFFIKKEDIKFILEYKKKFIR